jgi:phosphodiesterase/alkaline phosphatase D-like protein
VDEGHVSAEVADELRGRLATPEVAMVLRNFGVHLAITVPLRFPFGSLTRFAWTTGSRGRAEWLALRGRGSARLARQVHSLPVMIATLMPGFGSGAYLLSKPLRTNRALAVILLDRLLRRAPLRVYERLHLVALTTWWARPLPGREQTSWRSRVGPVLRERTALLRPYGRAVAAVLALNAVVLALATYLEQVYESTFAFSEDLGLVNTFDAAQLLAAGALGLLAFHWFWEHRVREASPAEAAGIFLWALTGLGLIAFAIDDFFGLHERLGTWIADNVGVLPLLTNNADDAITLAYGVVCLAILAMFRHELFARRASSALLAAAVLPSALMLLTDAYARGPVAWFERPIQTTAVALLLLAHLVREEELRPHHGGGAHHAHWPHLTAGHRPARWLLLAVRVWAATAAAVFIAIALRSGPPEAPEGPGLERIVQWGFLAAGALGVLITWRSVLVGGVVLTASGIALGVAANVAFTPREGLGVALLYGVPGVLLLAAWAATRPPWQASLVGAGVVAGFAGGGLQADRIHDHYYGAAHPSSAIEVEDSAFVEWVWSGAVTPSSVVVKTRLLQDSPAVRLVVEEAGGPAARRYSEVASVSDETNHRVASLAVGGLESGTRYRYWIEVDGRLDTTRPGEFTTFADGPFSFAVAVGSDARLGSNGAVFDAIREADPDLYVITGEPFYADIASNDTVAFREAYAEALSQPAPGALYRSAPVAYVWDDHDFGDNNADSRSASREAAQLVYRELVPHYPLASGEGARPIYHAFSVGRVRFLMTDGRSERTPLTILGAAQREWLKRELLAARDSHALTVWVNSVPWIIEERAGADDWGGYPEERRELADYIAEHRIDNLVMLAGDAHMIAFDDGSNSDYASAGGAGFPVIHAGALDRPGSVKGGPFSEGTIPGAGQFVLMTVLDDGGPELTVRWSGRDWTGTELMSLEFTTSDSRGGD